MDFFGGGTKVPAVVAGPRDEATATRDHLPWPPELPAPPWPPSVCSALKAPSCVFLCVGPVGSPECPSPFREGGVMSDLCHVCLVFPPLVSLYG